MNTQQLDEYCERRGLSAKARQVIDHVRSSPPSRLVQSGTKNVACRFASHKMGQVIQAESHQNELAAVIGWEHDENTHEFYDQPPKIKLRYVDRNGRASAHLKTTDFFLLHEDFTGWVECKTEDWLEARVKTGVGLYVKDEVAGWRCPPGEEYAAEFGMGFKVRSSSATEWIAIRNLQFLSDYLDERCPPPSAQSMARVHAEFSERPWIALKDLLDRIPTSDADTVFKMIADNILFFRMEDNLLTEPERTLIFHTRVAMEAYRCHLDSQAEPTLPSLRTLTVAPGQSMLWDGRVWRILNVGDEDIFIEDSENVITSLRREAFEQLVKDGVITGLPTGTVTVRNQAEELVRRTSPRDLEGAMQRYRCLFPGHFDEPAPKSCSRARRKWRAMYKRGQELYGSGLLGLIPRTSQRGNRLPRIDEAVVTVMEKVIDELYATNSGWSMVACWGEVCNRCNARSLLAPSLAAFRKQIRLRSKTEVVTAREGEKAAYSSSEFFWRLDASTPRHGERPFEIGHIDHTELDLQFRGSRRGEKLGKAWLSVLIDAWSRQVLAWIITFDPPSYRSCMLLLRECIVRHGRIPKTIVVDKGPDLQSVYLDTLLARLESHKKTRPGSRPRFGSVIERFFGVSNQQFTHCLQGNNLALQKPRQMSESHDPRELSVWTLPTFREAFETYLNDVYGAMEHPALGLSPKEALAIGLAQSGFRRHVLIPNTTDLTIMCLPSTRSGTVTIDSSRGIKINYIYYWTPAFRDPKLAGTEVPVRYDPNDKSVAIVWLKDHWEPCQSEFASVFRGHTEKEIALITQEITAKNRRTGTRQTINASLIAQHLTSARATEKVLQQRLKDQEMQAEPPPAVPSPAQDGRPSRIDAVEDNIWRNLENSIFGE